MGDDPKMTTRCPRCDGLGRMTPNSVPCTACGGTGEVPRRRKVKITGFHCSAFGREGRVVRDVRGGAVILLLPVPEDPEPPPQMFGPTAFREVLSP